MTVRRGNPTCKALTKKLNGVHNLRGAIDTRFNSIDTHL